MNMDTIREWLNRTPFQPFVLRLSNGEVYEVRHPENLALGRNRLCVSDPAADRMTHIALMHINSVESMQQTS